MDARREAFLILGPAGPETSALADMLVKLGVSPPATPVAADSANGAERWKSQPIAELQLEILESAGSSWSDWRPFNDNWRLSPAARRLRKRAIAVVTAEFGESDSFVLQDGVTGKLLPFWLDVLAEMNIAPKPMLPVRQPLETARFAQDLNELPLNHGLLLWLRHMLDTELHTRELPRSLVAWDALSTDWRATADKASSELGVHWARSGDRSAAEIDELFGAFRRMAERAPSTGEMYRDLPDWLDTAFQALLELARNPQSNSARAQLDEIRSRFETSASLFGLAMMDVELKNEKLSSSLKATSAKLEIKGLELDRSLKKIAAIEKAGTSGKMTDEATSQKHSDEILMLNCEKDALTVRLFDLQHQLDEVTRGRDSSLAEQHGVIQALTGERDALQQQLRELLQRLDQLGQDNARSLAEMQARLAELAAQKETLQQQLSAAQAHTQSLADLTAQKEALEHEHASLQVQFNQLRHRLEQDVAAERERLAALTADRGALAIEKAELSQHLEALKAHLDYTKQEHAGSIAAERARLEALGAEHAALRNERDDWNRHLEALQAQLNDIKQANASSLATERARFEALTAEHAALRIERDERNQHLAALQAHHDYVKREYDQRLASEQLRVDALLTQQNILQSEKAEISQRIEALQAVLETANQEHADTLAAERAKLALLHHERDEQTQKITSLQALLDETRQTHDQLLARDKIRLDALLGEQDRLQGENSQLSQRIEALQAHQEHARLEHAGSIAAEQARLAALTSEHEALRIERDERDQHLAALQAHLEYTKQEHAGSIAAEQARLAALTSEHEALRIERDERDQHLAALQAHHEYTTRQHEQAMAAAERWHADRLAEEQANANALRQEKEQSIATLENRIAESSLETGRVATARDEAIAHAQQLQQELEQARLAMSAVEQSLWFKLARPFRRSKV